MASKYLGKGLADLNKEMGTIPDISVLTGAERTVIKPIPLIQISPNEDQPRKTFTEEELSDLTTSIKEKGVLVPIILRTVQNKPYLYEIVAGERRYRAAKQAGLSEIPAIVKTLSDTNAMEIALIENVQRENLNPLEEAEAYKNLMTKCGHTLSDVSVFIGKSESYIKNILRITQLPDSVKELLKNKQISASHARTIITADDPEKMAKEIIDNHLSVEEIQKKINTTKQKRLKTSDDYIINKEKILLKHLKTPVKIKEKRGGAGEIIIKYNNRIQLEELIEQITK